MIRPNRNLEIVNRNRIRILVYAEDGEGGTRGDRGLGVSLGILSGVSVSEEIAIVNQAFGSEIGQTQLEGLLVNPNNIPESFRRENYILIASRSMVHGPFASRFVSCLYFSEIDSRWHLGMLWLDAGGRDRLISCV